MNTVAPFLIALLLASGSALAQVSTTCVDQSNNPISCSAAGQIKVQVQLPVAITTVTSFTVTPSNVSLAVAANQQLSWKATNSDGSTATVIPSFVSSAPAVATVSSGGLIMGVGAGSATITATVSTISVTVLVTVTAPVVTATCGVGSNASAFVSQTVPATMTAGQIYPVTVVLKNTGASTWCPVDNSPKAYHLGSQTPQDNTIWGKNRAYLTQAIPPLATATVVFNVTAPTVAGTYNFQWQMVEEGMGWFGASSPSVAVSVTSSGTTPTPTPTPTSTTDILHNMTPANFVTPAGWSIATTQDFELSLGNATPGTVWATDKTHSGAHAMKATYSGDGFGPGWWFEQLPPSAKCVYLHWYEYLATAFRENDEVFFDMFKKQSAAGSQLTRLQYEYMPYPLGFNSTTANLYFFPEGTGSYAQKKMIDGDDTTKITGRWVEWGNQYCMNTPGLSDGSWRVWRDGVELPNGQTNANLNGSFDMSGMLIGVGGTYTKHIWFADPAMTQCGLPGYYTDTNHRCADFTNCSPCQLTQNVPVFSRWWDDIIILYR